MVKMGKIGVVAILACGVLAACGGADPRISIGASETEDAAVCPPGKAAACVGSGGCSGGQICLEDGSGYGACDCSISPGDADGGSAVPEDSGVGRDSSSQDASVTPSDASPDVVSCVAKQCPQPGCGSQSDGCGGFIVCATCPPPDAGCVPKTCNDLGHKCGGASDGCGGFLNCGDPQVTCPAPPICKVNDCVGNQCAAPINKPNGVLCALPDSSVGKCQGGNCCAGCWDGAACQTGKTVGACGYTGNACVNCDDGNPCTLDTCSSGSACLHDPTAKNGVACAGGVCSAGSCVACGGSNQKCCESSDCNAGLSCQSGLCKPCGGSGQACCLDETPQCDTGFHCRSPGTCQACGDRNQDCCAEIGQAYQCKTQYMACTGNKCVCGGDFQTPCNGSASGCDSNTSYCTFGIFAGKCLVNYAMYCKP